MAAAEDVAERFGINLKRCRRRVDLSQEEAGLRASLHRTEIGLLEHGRRVARIDTLLKLMAALEADARELLEGITWVPRNPQCGQFVISHAFETTISHPCPLTPPSGQGCLITRNYLTHVIQNEPVARH